MNIEPDQLDVFVLVFADDRSRWLDAARRFWIDPATIRRDVRVHAVADATPAWRSDLPDVAIALWPATDNSIATLVDAIAHVREARPRVAQLTAGPLSPSARLAASEAGATAHLLTTDRAHAARRWIRRYAEWAKHQ